MYILKEYARIFLARRIFFTISQRNSHFCFDNIFESVSKTECIQRIQQIKPHGFKAKSGKEACVMIPLCMVSNEPSILFTVRSAKLGRNKNDVSFPGGIKDPDDDNCISAALRETEEEIGLCPNLVDIWTSMPPLPSRNNEFLITPVIGYIGQIEPENCKFNEDEVEAVFTETVSFLCEQKNRHHTFFKTRINYVLPVFITHNYRIWGVTAVILHLMLEALVPKIYNGKCCYVKK